MIISVGNAYGFSRGPDSFLTGKDLNEAMHLTSWIENETTRDMLLNYLVFCPEQDMCLGPMFRRNYTFLGTPACTTCDCDDSCVRKATCCPSKFYRQTNSPDFIEYPNISKPKEMAVPLSCIEPLWNTEGIKSGKSYWMVKTCPNGTECLHMSMSSKNITNYTPVTSVATNETYVNVHCAFCNQELLSNLIAWRRRKMCTLRSVLLADDDYGKLLNYVFDNSPICNIGFDPSAPIKNQVESCTGQTYDTMCEGMTRNKTKSYIADACKKYHLPFYTNQRIYKNLYCTLCDYSLLDINIQYEPTDVFDGPEFTHFSALMNFHQVKNEPVSERRTCQANRVFDRQTVS